MGQATSTQSGTNVRFCGGPGGPGIVRAVSTGLCRDLTGTRLFLGRAPSRPREGWVPGVFLQNPADTARPEPGPPGVPQKS